MSYSQSKQDLFALLVNPTPGFYLDIGCSVPKWQNNSRLLLANGWKGVNVDFQDYTTDWNSFYGSKFIQGDATAINWGELINSEVVPKHVNYVSVDVDFQSLAALENLLRSGIQSNCMTVENDFYRFGPELRDAQKDLMLQHGYLMALEGVKSIGYEYENWFIHSSVEGRENMVDELNTWGLT